MTSQHEFDEMATSLEEQLREKIPLIGVRVARFEEYAVPPSIFSITGKVMVNGKPLNVATAVDIKTWQLYPSNYLECLVDEMAGAIARAMVEWQPKETP